VVTLEAPGTPVPDPAGGFREVWAPLVPATWHCSIQAASLRDLERITGGAISSEATHVLRGRYHPGISTAARIRFGARLFEIQTVHDRDQRQIELVLICHEMTTGATGPRVAPEVTYERSGVSLAPREDPRFGRTSRY
jgi:head-tail adaptor